ncbi:MAG: carboxypeptidase regulatory-like domain-containing protein [Gemmatimonadetes bacterium]|nr:carboxypeptidase regulatory-like domain-containing protein [Gemmatimonadota bacterium]MCC6774426.1 carboxypeptidase regulatory-like domain-containing protein [Gemmatimonadaceae bacterium]
MHALARGIRTLLAVSASLAASVTPTAAQTMDGIVVVGADKRPVATSKVALLDRRQNVLDTTTTDVFGGFSLTAEKPGKYSLMVRRTGYYPILTDNFELLEDETRRDTVFLTGKMAEMSVKDVIEADVRRLFSSAVLGSFQRYLGPDDIEEMRPRSFTLGDLVRNGRMAGLQWYNPPSGCLRFSGSSGCAQVYLDGLPVYMRIDAISANDVEAIVAYRDMELGIAATTRGGLDNTRYGAVLVYTRRFTVR